MSKFSSNFASKFLEFLEYRAAMGIDCTANEWALSMFDRYCSEYHPHADTLTKEIARGWISNEIIEGRTGLANKVSGVRMFARYLGDGVILLRTA